ncbi:hypothetical protein ACH347_12065 [Saccharopolyspora sp. 5N102]|uniref:hypothetical protein n=1 Tax=Saccharopolyspora sp. 5N102 TaxID=3375155 RepID=UPI0037A695EE
MAVFSGQRAFATAISRALVDAMPGSRVPLIGSLGAGTDDEYSDIDLAWVVPDGAVSSAADRLGAALGAVAEVASVRSAPEFRRSALHRLVFARFRGVPLFWRLDLQLWAASHAFDADVPRASGTDCSLPESAAMNALGACKAVLRGRPETADGLLSRGFTASVSRIRLAGGHTASPRSSMRPPLGNRDCMSSLRTSMRCFSQVR